MTQNRLTEPDMERHYKHRLKVMREFAIWVLIPVLIALTLVIVVALTAWANVRGTEDRQSKKKVAVEECGSIEDEALRSICIRETD